MAKVSPPSASDVHGFRNTEQEARQRTTANLVVTTAAMKL